MTLSTLFLAVLLGGCSGSPPEAPQGAGEGLSATQPKKASAKKKKVAKQKPKKSKRPILRTGRFHIPLNAFGDDDIVGLKDAMLAAWKKVAKDGDLGDQNDEFPKPWKCRRASVWNLDAKEGTPKPEVRLYERMGSPECVAGDDAIERWELSLRYNLPEAPANRDGGGEFRYLMSGIDIGPEGEEWNTTYSHIFRRDSGKLEVAFPHDTAWLGEQLPEGISTNGEPARMNSQRWALGRVDILGEKLTVEVDRWSCVEGGAFAGAELVFRTNKREEGHSASSPKSVKLSEELQAFAEALRTELGDRVGGTGTVTAAGAACAP